MRILSNLVIHEVKKQYKEDPERFSRQVNIHDPAQQQEEEKYLAAAGIEVEDPENFEKTIFWLVHV